MEREIKNKQNDQESSSFMLLGHYIVLHPHDHNTERVQSAPATIAHTSNGGCDVHKASSSTTKQKEDQMMMVNQSLISDSEPPTKNQIKNSTLLSDGTVLVGQQEHENKKNQEHHSTSSFEPFRTPIHLHNEDQTHNLHVPTNSVPAAAPELPPQFCDHIHSVYSGTDIKFLAKKRLEKTDLSKSHARLALPQSSISRGNTNFLTAAEAQELLVKYANGKLGSIGVTVIDPKLNAYQMKLGKWFYAQSENSEKEPGFSYSLHAGWTKVRECNKFTVGQVLHIWSFRIGTQLGIAIVADAPTAAAMDVAAPLFPTWGRRARRT